MIYATMRDAQAKTLFGGVFQPIYEQLLQEWKTKTRSAKCNIWRPEGSQKLKFYGGPSEKNNTDGHLVYT